MKFKYMKNSHTKITVFQALTLLINKYSPNQGGRETYNKINKLYLTGAYDSEDTSTLTTLMQDTSLENYIISHTKTDLNEDPVRRYFESHLCYETIGLCLDQLDINLLTAYCNSIIKISGNNYDLDRFLEIYADPIKILQQYDLSASLSSKDIEISSAAMTKSNERLEKLCKLHKIYLATQPAFREFNPSDKLNLFFKKNYIYETINRGRKQRTDQLEPYVSQCVFSHNLGIMKAYMPLPPNDPLYLESKTSYMRGSDKETYIDGSQQPELAFFNKVTPFSGSISGCLLRQIILIERLNKKNRFTYSANEEQLKLYFKCFIAFGVYLTGSHTLNEFVSVLQLPEVQYTFRAIPGFIDLNLTQLFKSENKLAFDQTVFKTIDYNHHIINKKRIHQHMVNSSTYMNNDMYFLNDNSTECETRSMYSTGSYTEWNLSKPDDRLLLEAARNGHNQLVDFFIKQRYALDLVDTDNDTALDLALRYDHWITAVLLMRAGAKANYSEQLLQRKLLIYLKKCDLENLKMILASQPQVKDGFLNNEKFLGCLFYPVRHNKLDVIKFMISIGANINQSSSTGVTLVMIAAGNGADATLAYLLENHATLDNVTNSSFSDQRAPSIEGLTALHFAALGNNLNGCRMLIKAGASLDVCDKNGRTPEDRADNQAQLAFDELKVMSTVTIGNLAELSIFTSSEQCQNDSDALKERDKNIIAPNGIL